MKRYYIYRHIRLDTNTPFYIGKGSDKRAYSKECRNQYWHNIVNKYEYRVEIIRKGLSEKEAFSKEIEFIALYREYGYCEANLTDGGEGPSGYSHTKEAKLKMSEAKKGLPSPNKGKLFNAEWRVNISKAKKGTEMHPNTKKALLKANIGKPGTMLGRKHSEETKKLMSKKQSIVGNKAQREVLDTRTGKVYKSIRIAAIELDIVEITLRRHLKKGLTGKFPYLKYKD